MSTHLARPHLSLECPNIDVHQSLRVGRHVLRVHLTQRTQDHKDTSTYCNQCGEKKEVKVETIHHIWSSLRCKSSLILRRFEIKAEVRRPGYEVGVRAQAYPPLPVYAKVVTHNVHAHNITGCRVLGGLQTRLKVSSHGQGNFSVAYLLMSRT